MACNFFWIAFVFATLAVILELVSKLDKNKLRGTVYSVLIAFFICASLFTNYKESNCQDAQNGSLSNSIGLARDTISLIKQESKMCIDKIDSANKAISEIMSAIHRAGYRYDSVNTRLVPQNINSQFNIPNARFNAPVQVGNGNTQKN